MYILCTIKTRRAARTNSVGAKDLNGFLFQSFVADEIIEIVGSKVGNCATV